MSSLEKLRGILLFAPAVLQPGAPSVAGKSCLTAGLNVERWTGAICNSAEAISVAATKSGAFIFELETKPYPRLSSITRTIGQAHFS